VQDQSRPHIPDQMWDIPEGLLELVGNCLSCQKPTDGRERRDQDHGG
jgi:hypothetical protein